MQVSDFFVVDCVVPFVVTIGFFVVGAVVLTFVVVATGFFAVVGTAFSVVTSVV